MMKAAILLVVLAVLAGGQTAVLDNAQSRANMQVGIIQPGDRLLYSTVLQRNPIINAAQYQYFTYHAPAYVRISAVTATEVGYTQFASAWVTQGGPGWGTVTVRVQSAVSRGYHYRIQVWGR